MNKREAARIRKNMPSLEEREKEIAKLLEDRLCEEDGDEETIGRMWVDNPAYVNPQNRPVLLRNQDGETTVFVGSVGLGGFGWRVRVSLERIP